MVKIMEPIMGSIMATLNDPIVTMAYVLILETSHVKPGSPLSAEGEPTKSYQRVKSCAAV